MSRLSHPKMPGVKIVMLVATITLGTYLFGYFWSRNSEAFDVAKNYIVTSRIVEAELGKVEEIKLQPFGYELDVSGTSGSAGFDCDVTGKSAKGIVSIKLRKRSDVWTVTEATLGTPRGVVSLKSA